VNPAPTGGIGDLAGTNGKLGQLPQRWRNTVTNQVYTMRFDADHLYINQAGGAIVADLTLKKDGRGNKPDKYEGSSRLARCPNGSIEVVSWSATRIEARVQIPGKPGKVWTIQIPACPTGMGKTWEPMAFIPE
jgi:hypothetical protein